MTSAFSWQNSISLCPASFCTPQPNLPVTLGISWLPTFAFQSPIMKRTSFLGVSSRRSCKLLFTALDFTSITGHIHNWVLILLRFHLLSLFRFISPLIYSSILGTYWPGEFMFQCPIFVLFCTLYGVLKARILKWFDIPFSSGQHFVLFIIHDWNSKVGSQKTPKVTGKFGLGIWNEAVQKANRVMPREHTGHSKHHVPTTQEKTLHMDITRWLTLKSD